LSKPSGNDAFCVIRNVAGKLKDAATRCVSTFETRRAVDASTCVRGRDLPGETHLAGFGTGEYRRGIERASREGKGTEGDDDDDDDDDEGEEKKGGWSSGGFRLGPGGHRPPNLAQAPPPNF